MSFYELSENEGLFYAVFYYIHAFLTYGWISEILLVLTLILLITVLLVLGMQYNFIKYFVSDVLNSNKYLIKNILRENKNNVVSMKNIFKLYLHKILENSLGNNYKKILKIVFFSIIIMILVIYIIVRLLN